MPVLSADYLTLRIYEYIEYMNIFYINLDVEWPIHVFYFMHWKAQHDFSIILICDIITLWITKNEMIQKLSIQQ